MENIYYVMCAISPHVLVAQWSPRVSICSHLFQTYTKQGYAIKGLPNLRAKTTFKGTPNY